MPKASDEIKDGSKVAHFMRRTFRGIGKGLVVGLGIGLAAGLVFSGVGAAIMGGGIASIIAGTLHVGINTAVLGGLVGGAWGALQGVNGKPRPKGALREPQADSGMEEDGPAQSQVIAPQVQQEQAVAQATAPAENRQVTSPEVEALRDLNNQLDQASKQPGQWQQRVALGRRSAGASQMGV